MRFVAHCGYQVVQIGLQQAGSYAECRHLVRQFERVIHGDDEYCRFRKLFVDLPSGFQAIEVRHAKIEHDNIRALDCGQGHSLLSSCGFSADFPTLLFQYFAHVPSHEGMVIGYENTRHIDPLKSGLWR